MKRMRMKKKRMDKVKKNIAFMEIVILLIILILFFIYNVSAFSIATLYGENYPMMMKPGETKETFFLIRNVVEGDSDVEVSIELAKGVEVAKLIDTQNKYEIASGAEVEVPVRITIPQNAEVGKIYYIGAIFKPSSGKTEVGNIQFLVNIGKTFPVVVTGEKKESSAGKDYSLTVEEEGITESFAPFIKRNLGFFWIIVVIISVGIIILVFMIVFILKKNREMKMIERRFMQGNQQAGAGLSQYDKP